MPAAEAYLRENVRKAITLTDLCVYMDVPERTLRQGFREVYGLSPMAHLKALRMQAARVQLRQPRRDRRISDIASECGFTHLGRFSIDYGRCFGETPSETRFRSLSAWAPVR
ncbi:MAG: helix-turn-helix transcriptional regulator [Deltaproteobacteria bacterium]|nr:helix-turn-helix transcriptional regulator [Deltaproteobacteria bacterium]